MKFVQFLTSILLIVYSVGCSSKPEQQSLGNPISISLHEGYPCDKIAPLFIEADSVLSVGKQMKNWEEQPIFSVFGFNLIEENGMNVHDKSSCIIGACSSQKDTNQINKYLSTPSIKSMFPSDVIFKWTPKVAFMIETLDWSEEVWSELSALKQGGKSTTLSEQDILDISIEKSPPIFFEIIGNEKKPIENTKRYAVTLHINDSGIGKLEQLSANDAIFLITVTLCGKNYTTSQMFSDIKQGIPLGLQFNEAAIDSMSKSYGEVVKFN